MSLPGPRDVPITVTTIHVSQGPFVPRHPAVLTTDAQDAPPSPGKASVAIPPPTHTSFELLQLFLFACLV